MGDLADMLSNNPPPSKAPKAHTPAGWEAGVQQKPGQITITTPPLEAEPDQAVWAELIADWDIDPNRYIIAPNSLQFRGWDAAVGGGDVKRLRYYRATLLEKGVVRCDVEELIKIASVRKPAKRDPWSTTHPPLVVSINDWQIGKGEGGGSPATVTAVVECIAGVRRRLRELARLKRRPSKVVLANTGDITEAVSGHYPSQAFTVDLNQREQLRVARRLLFRFVDELVTDGYEVVVTAVPCNHGENRNGAGKAQTTVDDNASLTIVEGIEEACTANLDRYAAVSFAYADDLTLVVDTGGVNVGLTHGHQIRGSGPAAARVEKWWQGQIMGNQPIAAADMIITSHLHHLQMSEETGRPVFVSPAMDGGSYWYTSATGRTSPRGMLTMTIGDAHHRGWGDLEIIG